MNVVAFNKYKLPLNINDIQNADIFCGSEIDVSKGIIDSHLRFIIPNEKELERKNVNFITTILGYNPEKLELIKMYCSGVKRIYGYFKIIGTTFTIHICAVHWPKTGWPWDTEDQRNDFDKQVQGNLKRLFKIEATHYILAGDLNREWKYISEYFKDTSLCRVPIVGKYTWKRDTRTSTLDHILTTLSHNSESTFNDDDNFSDHNKIGCFLTLDCENQHKFI